VAPVEAVGAAGWNSGLQLLAAAVEVNSAAVLKPINQKPHYWDLILFNL